MRERERGFVRIREGVMGREREALKKGEAVERMAVEEKNPEKGRRGTKKKEKEKKLFY